MNTNKKALTRGEKVCAFIETYCLEPDKLEKFQRKFILEICDNPVGTHTAMLSIARKNGKTALITETQSRKLKEQLGMLEPNMSDAWQIIYNNDSGPDDDGFWEWWDVTDGNRSFRCDSEEDAKWLVENLSRSKE